MEFATLMWFDSLDSVKTFMGDDYDVAHVPLVMTARRAPWFGDRGVKVLSAAIVVLGAVLFVTRL